MLRFGNIFGNQQPWIDESGAFPQRGMEFPRRNPYDTVDLGAGNPLPTPGNDDPEMFKFEPEHRYSDQFDELIKQMPQRDNPGFWRKFAATIAAGGIGPERAEKALYAPHNRRMEDWESKIKPVQAGMIDERSRNAQQRQYTQSINTYGLAAKNAETRQTAAEAKIANDRERTEISRASMEVRKFKAEHPNHQFKTDADGHVYSIDPQNNKVEYLRGPDGNPVKSDKLPEQTKLDIQLDHATDLIRSRDIATRGQIQLRGGIESGHITKRGEESRKTQAAPRSAAPRPSTATGDKPLTPSGVKQDRVNKADEYKASHPEMSKWITVKSGDVEIKPPSKSWIPGMGPDQASYDAAYEAIYGKKTQPMSSHGGDTGKVRVQSPDGKQTGTIDRSELAEALKNKWKEIK